MLKNRLLAIGVTLFLIGIIIAEYSDGAIVLLCLLAVSVLCILLCTVRFFKQNITRAALFALIPIIGAVFLLFYRNIFVIPYSVYDGKTGGQTGTVVSVSTNSYDISVISSTANVPKGTLLRVYTDSDASVGDTVAFSGKLRFAGSKSSMISSGVKLYASSYDFSVINTDTGPIYTFRSNVIKALESSFEKQHSDFIKAITLNDKTDLSAERYDMYRIAGAAAYFSVSGLHVTCVVMIFMSLLKYFNVSKHVRGTLSALLALLYGFVVGFSPSVMRSVIMLLVIIAVQLAMSESDSITSLFLALGVLLLHNPYSFASVSLQLSFSATFGAIYTANTFTYGGNKKKIKSFLFGFLVLPVIISIGCFAFTLPFVFLSFDVISLMLIFSNIWLSIIFTPLLPLALIAALFGALHIPIIPILKQPIVFLIDSFDFICERMSTGFRLVIPNGNFFATTAAVIAVVTILIIFFSKDKIRKTAFCLAFVLITSVLSSGCYILNKNVQTTTGIAYKCSYNGSSVIAMIGGEKIYIDCGAGLDTTFIYSQNITDIDIYVVTEYDNDTASEISYAVNRLNAKKLMLLNVGLPIDELDSYDSIITAINSGCEIIDSPFLELSSGDALLYVDAKNICLFSDNNAFAVTQNGDLSDMNNISDIVINRLPYEDSESFAKLMRIPNIYTPSGIDLPERFAAYSNILYYGTIVEARLSKDGKIEVKVNES